jgi:chemotaxis protein CheZ
VSQSGDPIREQVLRRMRAALWAIEHGDEAGWRAQVDALIEWRSQPLVQGLVRLAREVGQALGDGDAGAESLAEACARLEHVVRLGEDASHRTLDMIEQCRGLLALVPGEDAAVRADAVAALRSNLSEMTAAQGVQDLTGQIILRVVDLVRCVHQGLSPQAAEKPLQLSPAHGHGPAVAGIDAAPATQDDANQLLSSLGL